MGPFAYSWFRFITVMQIFLKAAEAVCVEASPEDQVCSLRAKLHQFGYDTTDIVLSHNGGCLEDDLTLAQAGLNELATVEVFSRMVGGKVHGSLARAGKVKGQTPKVDPQEKKKKKLVEQPDVNSTTGDLSM